MPDNNHLSDETILELLSIDSASDPDVSHLQHCGPCQKKLESLAAEDWWWNEGRQLYSSTAQLIKKQEAESKELKRFDPVAAEVEAIVEHFSKAIHPELIGEVDEFQIESLIGVGGMGVVFKGFDRELNRPVAIKFLSPRLAQSGLAKQRFAREAKSIAAVCHDNIIPIFRINTKWLYPFLVMPYISGGSLEQLIQREGTLEAAQLVQIASQIASGLSEAHEQGLIHRDIKPGNILLENNFNRIVITDFGLVHDENDVRLTQTGVVAGTPQFMSPEQTEGKTVDARADLFSLGAVMYCMATGKAPFQAKSQFEMLCKIRNENPPRVRSLNPGIPAKLEAIIESLLQKNPAKRIGSAHELESLLRQYSAHLQNPMKNRAPKVGRSMPIKAIMLGLLSFVALGCVGAWFLPPLIRNTSSSMLQEQPKASASSNNANQPLHVNVPEFGVSTLKSARAGEDEQKLVEAFAKSNPILGIDEDKDRKELQEYRRVFGLVDRVAEDFGAIDSNPLKKLVLLNKTHPELANRVILLWLWETRKKYGRKDLFVVEPILISTQLKLIQGDWKEAESGFRRIEGILENNFASVEIQNQVAEFSTACSVQTDSSQFEDLLRKSVNELYPAISTEFSRRLD